MVTIKSFAVRSFLLLILFTGSVFAQSSTTSLQGTVTDPSGAAVANATVTLVNAESKSERTTVTGTQGEYRFQALPPGTYTLTVVATGFARQELRALQLLVNTPATYNLQLKVGGTTETVSVTSEAPPLNLVDASLGTPFTETQVRELPLDGRNVPELLSLQAGVTFTGNTLGTSLASYKDQDTRNGAVNGARSDQSNITLDGVDVNDQNSGYAFTSVLPITQDSVQEFRVTTTNYNAEEGTGSGALLPTTLLMLALSSRAGGLAQRVGPRWPMTAGTATCAVGLLLLTRVGAHASYVADVLPAVIVFGLGLSLTVAPLTATVLASADVRHAGVASGVNNTVARAAGLLAVAGLPAVVGLTSAAYHSARGLRQQLPVGHVPLRGAARGRRAVLSALTIDKHVLRAAPDRPVPEPECKTNCAVGCPPLEPKPGSWPGSARELMSC